LIPPCWSRRPHSEWRRPDGHRRSMGRKLLIAALTALSPRYHRATRHGAADTAATTRASSARSSVGIRDRYSPGPGSTMRCWPRSAPSRPIRSS
jgi:hypothetical protein